MYETFYGLREKPFNLSPDPSYLFMSSKHERVYNYLRYALLENKGFVVITGEIGSGKTTLIKYILSKIQGIVKVAYIYNTTVSPSQFLKLVALELKIPIRGLDKVGIFEALKNFLLTENRLRRRVVLVVDEAQNLSLSTLEEIRLVSNLGTEKEPLWQIVLVGQPELRRKLKHPSLKQLVQRITVHCHLEPLNLEETKLYVRHRLRKAGGSPEIFTEEALEEIYTHSKGIPRLINLICDTALVYGFADGLRRIGPEVIESVVKDRQEGGLFYEVEASPFQLREEGSSLPSLEEILSHLKNLEDRVRILEALVSEFAEYSEFLRSLKSQSFSLPWKTEKK